jgi:transcriptional regulator with XRE-family HTH domain
MEMARLGWDNTRFAAESGIGKHTVGNWVKAAQWPDYDNLQKAATALGVSAAYLLFGPNYEGSSGAAMRAIAGVLRRIETDPDSLQQLADFIWSLPDLGAFDLPGGEDSFEPNDR